MNFDFEINNAVNSTISYFLKKPNIDVFTRYYFLTLLYSFDVHNGGYTKQLNVDEYIKHVRSKNGFNLIFENLKNDERNLSLSNKEENLIFISGLNFDKISHDFSKKFSYVYGSYYKKLLESLYFNLDLNGLHTSYTITPLHIGNLIKELLNIQSNRTLYDPCMGVGLLLIENDDEKSFDFYGKDYSYKYLEQGLVNAYLNDLKNFKFECEDAIKTPLFCDYFSKFQGFDYVICHPPFGSKNQSEYKDNHYFPDFMKNNNRVEYDFIYHSLASLNSTGKCALILPYSFLFGSSNVSYLTRKYLIDKNILEGVILLPTNIYNNTSIASVIIILSSNKKNNEVSFIDASFKFILENKKHFITEEAIREVSDIFYNKKETNFSTKITIEDIQQQDYQILTYKKYLKNNQTLLPEVPENFEDFQLAIDQSKTKIYDLENQMNIYLKQTGYFD